MKVVLQKDLYERAFTPFSEAEKKFELEYLVADALDETRMLQYHSEGANCFVIGAEAYSRSFYESLRSGAAVIRYGVGYNAVPVDLCSKRGIKVAYTPDTLTDSVAEYATALLLALSKHTVALDNSMRRKLWQGISGVELKGKTIAILGYGQIGKAVAKIVKQGFGMIVHAFDKVENSQDEIADLFSTNYEEAVKDADFVSMHIAVRPDTRGFFNSERISKCKDGVLFINTSRGDLVSEKDLFDALLSKKIGGAALDVYVNEPYNPPEDMDLRKLPNVVLTPHCGSNTAEANSNMAQAVIKNILSCRDGKEMTLIPELKIMPAR